MISTSIAADDSTESPLDVTFDKVIAEIQDAGANGWEAVGGIDFRIRRRKSSSSTLNFPTLLFKRPKSSSPDAPAT